MRIHLAADTRKPPGLGVYFYTAIMMHLFQKGMYRYVDLVDLLTAMQRRQDLRMSDDMKKQAVSIDKCNTCVSHAKASQAS